jgi:hypothetical protein
MLRKLYVRKVLVSRRRDQADLKILFSTEAMTEVLHIEDTEVGKKPAGEANNNDPWDVERTLAVATTGK